jgi:hypothetical protein
MSENRSCKTLIYKTIIGWFSISHLLSLGLIMLAVIIRLFIYKKGGYMTEVIDKEITQSRISVIKDLAIVLFLIAISVIIFYTVQS